MAMLKSGKRGDPLSSGSWRRMLRDFLSYIKSSHELLEDIKYTLETGDGLDWGFVRNVLKHNGWLDMFEIGELASESPVREALNQNVRTYFQKGDKLRPSKRDYSTYVRWYRETQLQLSPIHISELAADTEYHIQVHTGDEEQLYYVECTTYEDTNEDEEERPMTISNRNAAILLDETLHTVTCIYEEGGKEYKFLALKVWGVKTGDCLLVAEDNGGNHNYLKTVVCIGIDADADVDIDRGRQYRFISGIFNDLLTGGEARLAEAEAIVKKSRKKQARDALRATLAVELQLDNLLEAKAAE